MRTATAFFIFLLLCGACFGEPIVIEAEHGVDIRLNAEIKEMKGASGGLALTYGEGAGGEWGMASVVNRAVFIGRAEYDFEIKKGGLYHLSARVFWIDKCGNQIGVKFDNGERFLMRSGDDQPHTFGKWYWHRSSIGPFEFKAGRHKLTFIANEDGPAIDQWCIHPDGANIPKSDTMKEKWPSKFSEKTLAPVLLSLMKPSEIIGAKGTVPLTVWVRKRVTGAAECVIKITGMEDMKIKPSSKFPLRFKKNETLKRVDVTLIFPKKTPRGEKKVRAVAYDGKGKVTATAMCILSRPWDWYILGPLPAEAAMEEKFSFGNLVDLSTEVEDSRWKRLPLSAFNPYQTIDFEKLYGQSVSKTAYLYTEISAPEEKKYLLLINNDCALKLWVDGKLIREDLRHHPAEGWLRQLELPLRKGRHKVLVRVEQDAEADNEWQVNHWLFRMRIRDKRKTPSKITGLECGVEK